LVLDLFSIATQLTDRGPHRERPRRDKYIARRSDKAADVRALIIVDLVRVVALLDSRPHDAVATDGVRANVRACIRVGQVRVVTALAWLGKAVTASRRLANVRAGVRVGLVCVVALLNARAHNAVAASG